MDIGLISINIIAGICAHYYHRYTVCIFVVLCFDLFKYAARTHNPTYCHFPINTLSAKDGDLRLSASNACLPKTDISVFVTECVFFTSTCYKIHCSHCMMCYTVRKKECSSLFWYKAIIVWFSQFIMTVVQN